MIDEFKAEKWVDIDVVNILESEKFQVSNFGRLRSFKVSPLKPRLINGSWLSGYNVIVIKLKNGKSNTFYVHKLVAQYFIENDDDDRNIVIHIDFDNSNNHFSNLKWVNQTELNAHRHNDVNYDNKKIRNSKLTEMQVVIIKRMLVRGNVRPYRIAQQYGISQTQLIRIKNGTNWGHINID